MKLTTVDVNSWETLASDTMCVESGCSGFRCLIWRSMDFMEPEYHKNWPGAALEYHLAVTHKCLPAVCLDLG